MSRARDRRGALVRTPTTQNLLGSFPSGLAPGTAYHREVTYPNLPLTLDEIYDRAAKYTDKLLARPVFYLDNEDGDDASPAAPPVPPSGAAQRARLGRQQSSEKRMSLATSPFPGASQAEESIKRPGYDRRRTTGLPGSSLDGVARRLSGPGSEKGYVLPGVHEGRRSGMGNSNVPPSIAEDEAASIAASVVGSQEGRKQKLVIWPEWNDTDVNAEKWDAPHKGKEKEKGKSPSSMQHFFDDPEGRIEMPPSLRARVDHFLRPQDFITDKMPVIYDPDNGMDFDLLSANSHINDCETMRWIISQITSLWRVSIADRNEPETSTMSVVGGVARNWRPWDHIFALCRVGKGPHQPQYNPHGKYIVRLYWMGCWRKVTIDDTIPFDDNGNMLLPATTLQHELWPMLLSKALIKVISLDYAAGSSSCEFGDVSVIHALTGWLPETIPLQRLYQKMKHALLTKADMLEELIPAGGTCNTLGSDWKVQDFQMVFCQPREQDYIGGYGHLDKVWLLLKQLLPEFKLPDPEEQMKEADAEGAGKKDCKSDEVSSTTKESRKEDKPGKEGKSDKSEKGGKESTHKEHKDDKKDKKDKDKEKDKRPIDKEGLLDKDQPTPVIPETPQVAVFVSYQHPPKVPIRISVLGEMADASERLRQAGLSHVNPHPLLITQTRSCPLVAPPPPPKIPAWKMIRPKKKKVAPTDEAAELEVKKPEQFVQLTSPYVNYRVSPIPIPTDIKRPRSSLSRGGSRTGRASSCMLEIHEVDENAPEKSEEEEAKAEEERKAAQEQKRLQEMSMKSETRESLFSEKPPDGISPVPTTCTSPNSRRKTSAVVKRVDNKSPKVENDKEKEKSVSPTRKKSARKVSKGSDKTPGKAEPKVVVKETKVETKETKEKESCDKSELGSLKPGDEMTDTVSVVTGAGEGLGSTMEGEAGSAELPKEEVKVEKMVPKDIWMDFEDFCKCFKTLYIFHKPATYLCNHRVSDLKKLDKYLKNIQLFLQVPKGVQPAGSKKSAAPGGPNPSASMTSQTPARIPFSPSPQHHEKDKTPLDDRAPHYFFVDNLETTEIIVSFSALSRWFDPPLEPPKTSHSSTREKDKHKDAESVAGSSSVADGVAVTKEPATPNVPGLLVAEPYSWKSLVVGQPILRIRTTSTKAAALTLPPGRHVLRFTMSAPLGYHVHLCSTVPFVYGDEETVMTHLVKESCRFVDHANQLMRAIGNVIQQMDNAEALKETMTTMNNLHCPVWKDRLSVLHNFDVFGEAIFLTLRKAFGENFSTEVAYAWKVFTLDVNSKTISGISYAGSRPDEVAAHETTATAASRKSAKLKKREVPETWQNREPTEDEMDAVTIIAKHWRGYFIRKIRASRMPGSDENLQAKEQLLKVWTTLEANLEQYALHLFRTMFKIDPEMMPDFPFYQDEWNRISYVDFQGTYQEQPANSWFVVFRDVFYVQEPMLVVPKLYVSIPTCMLRVIDNDTGEEIPRVFQRVAPYEYKHNKRGYTFVAEARTIDLPLPSGKWRMRLIGSSNPLPQPSRDHLNSNFIVREIRDYYIPNKEDIIMRYVVKPQEDHVASIQFSTSKPDVYVSLQVLDHEEEMVHTTGKGHAVIPAFTFHRDKEPGEEEERRSGSRVSVLGRGTKPHHGSSSSLNSTRKRQPSASSHDGRASRASRGSADRFEDGGDEAEFRPHKYIIQAKVLRKSWPLSESSWAFVQVLKELEKNDLKAYATTFSTSTALFRDYRMGEDLEMDVTSDMITDRPQKSKRANKERPASPGKEGGKGPATKGEKKGKGKDKGKDKDKDKDKGNTSRPPSQQFDFTKPNWTLRVVLDQTPTEEVEIKRDTERQDEIRAMKQAWEAAEPGRAAKAQAARERFLKEHLIKVEMEEDGEEKTDQEAEVGPPQTPASESEHPPSEAVLTNEPPPPPPPKEILRTVDLTPYIRPANFTGKPRLKDEVEIERQTQVKQEEVRRYRAFRDAVMEAREEDKRDRNQTKERQLQKCIELQTSLDERRLQINEPREAFRQKFLEAERKRLEEIAAAEAALKAEQERKRSPSPKGRKSPKGKKSPNKKGGKSAKGKKK
ncbi:androglobin-like [Acanthaster planci]|uniref:Androglobin-like n=1 Tax=Acanthaster planci TaxID=133434 RepID=A0A8B7XNJ2_ACAPL|nr:androglobin-like [Acanthaster planci]